MGPHAGWRMPQTHGWVSPHRPLHGRRREKTRRVDNPSSRKTLGLHQSASDETASVETTSVGTTSAQTSADASETTIGLKTRSAARCTTTFSNSRMQARIRSTYAGGAFHSVEIGRSGPPFASGWKMRSSHLREPIGYSG